MERDPLGRIALLVIILVLFYDTIFALFKTDFLTITNALAGFVNFLNDYVVSIGGTEEPLFPITENLVASIFNWGAFVLTNSLGFATLIAIDMIKMGFKSGR